MRVNELQKKVHSTILIYRSIERIIDTEDFLSLWERSDDNQKQEITTIVLNKDKYGLIRWMRQHPAVELIELPIHILRDMACKLNIYKYSRLSKVELIRAIRAKNRDENRNA